MMNPVDPTQSLQKRGEALYRPTARMGCGAA